MQAASSTSPPGRATAAALIIVTALAAGCTNLAKQQRIAAIEAACPSPLVFKPMDDSYWRPIYTQCRDEALQLNRIQAVPKVPS